MHLYSLIYPPLIHKLAKHLANHQPADHKMDVVYCNPEALSISAPSRSLYTISPPICPPQEDEIAASELGSITDSVVVWQGPSEPVYSAFTDAEARVNLVSGGSAGQAQLI